MVKNERELARWRNQRSSGVLAGNGIKKVPEAALKKEEAGNRELKNQK